MSKDQTLFNQLPDKYPYFLSIAHATHGRIYEARFHDNLRIKVWFKVDSFHRDTGITIDRTPYKHSRTNYNIIQWNKAFKVIDHKKFEILTGMRPNTLKDLAEMSDDITSERQARYKK